MTTTFIIPTIGRPTLQRTVDSLMKQTDPNWKAIIVFDGIDPMISFTDPRIKCMKINKTGICNHAGKVRNAGMKLVDTEWISFVDDDDTISENYVNWLQEESADNKEIDVIVFRMQYENGRILPPVDSNAIIQNSVGISFSMKKQLFDNGYQFIPCGYEDYELLSRIKNVYVSKHIAYFVRH
jgi:glycosyltransferase involved in cell wall biosynthesis